MTSVTNSPPVAPPGGGPPPGRPAVPPPRARLRRSRAPVQGSPEGLPLRRRWGRFAAGAILALLGAWIFASLYLSAGERKEVLALARDVPRFQEIERDDLRTVRVAADPGVDTVPAGDTDDIVGRIASTGLREGSLLADSQLVPEGESVVAEDEATVPLELPRGATPDASAAGMEVMVVIVPSDDGAPAAGAGSTGERSAEIRGWLYSIGDLDEQTRTRHVDLVVDQFAVDDVTAAAADDRVRLALPGGGGD